MVGIRLWAGVSVSRPPRVELNDLRHDIRRAVVTRQQRAGLGIAGEFKPVSRFELQTPPDPVRNVGQVAVDPRPHADFYVRIQLLNGLAV